MEHRKYAIAATGHRSGKLFGYDLHAKGWINLGFRMRGFLLSRIGNYGAIRCISGMALGVDQLWALVALKLRNQGYPVFVTAALPCRNQNARWKSDGYWRDILERADETVLIYDGPYDAVCMEKRNRWMVDRADEILAVWDGSRGGTANCVRYARLRGVSVINIYDTPKSAPRLI